MNNAFKKTVLFLGLTVLIPHSTHAATKSASKSATKPVGTSAPAISGPAKSQASSTPARPVMQSLDQAMVKKYYNDGDFDQSIKLLEEFQKTHSKYTREESLMVYKYLGVMYCADQSTREKGKTYFYKLLKIDPEAKILDMYVSIVVQDIFRSTLDELLGQRGLPPSGREDRLTGPEPKPGQESFPARKEQDKNPEPEKISAGNHAVYWWIGGLAVAAGVAGGYYIYAKSSPSTRKDVDIPVPP
ncbi:MAG: hypothetical protein JWO30_945 [Fibrobacteres bacterium]|nr:hypothetical protein [Fibrobacterota bacterium]